LPGQREFGGELRENRTCSKKKNGINIELCKISLIAQVDSRNIERIS